MVYGMILLEHIKWKPAEQRVGIQNFAKKIGLKIDKILSYTEQKHVWDGLEQGILSMYEAGNTIYAIGKKIKTHTIFGATFFNISK